MGLSCFVFIQILLLVAVLNLAQIRGEYTISVSNVSQTIPIPPSKELFFDQVLDHFNYASFGNQKFKHRYLLSDVSYKPGGPLLFYTGNENVIDKFYSNSGFVFEAAAQLNALVVFAEHRFYGKSLPCGNQTFVQPCLGLLNIEQVLADYAVMIDGIQKLRNMSGDPVIVVGGSYGGILATVMRIKFPGLVDGAFASSAPVLPGADYYKQATKVFAQEAPGCDVSIRQGFAQMGELVAASSALGFGTLTRTFNLCAPLNATGYHQLLGWITQAYYNLVPSNYPVPTTFSGSGLPANPVKVACGMIASNPNGVLAGMAQAAQLYFPAKNGCVDIFEPIIFCAVSGNCFPAGPLNTAWDYLSCTQLDQTGGSQGGDNDMFPPLPLTEADRIAYCRNKFNVTPRATDVLFFEADLASASNIILSTGTKDVYFPATLTRSLPNNVTAIVIQDAAHHLDLRSSSPADPPSVRQARLQEIKIMRQFIEAARAAKAQ